MAERTPLSYGMRDEGDSYRYEEGVCSQSAGAMEGCGTDIDYRGREGNYPGMPEQVRMQVKLYLPEGTVPENQECVYTGQEIKIKF